MSIDLVTASSRIDSAELPVSAPPDHQAPECTDPLPAYLADLVRRLRRSGDRRWRLGQIITQAEDAPGLTDAWLRERLLC